VRVRVRVVAHVIVELPSVSVAVFMVVSSLECFLMSGRVPSGAYWVTGRLVICDRRRLVDRVGPTPKMLVRP
jgi:hypothetical protein